MGTNITFSTASVLKQLDTTAPKAADAPDLRDIRDSGTSYTDNLTRVINPVMRISLGTSDAKAGDTVDLREGETVRGRAILTASDINKGYVDIISSALTDGEHSLTSRVTDAAGNVGATSGTLTVKIDTAAPKAADAPDLDAARDSGTSKTDKLTRINKPVMRISLGTSDAKAGDTVDLREGETVRGTATLTDSDINKGYVDITSSALADGEHRLTSRVTDAAGNVGATSGKLTVKIDTAAPKAADAPDLDAASDSGTSKTDHLTRVIKPVMRISLGTSGAKAGDTVDLREGETVRGTATLTDSNVSKGYVDITSSALADGEHRLTSRVTDAAGNVGATSGKLTVKIDTAAPKATDAPDLRDISDSGTSKTDKLTRVTNPVIRISLGTSDAVAGDTVQLRDGEAVLGTATLADSNIKKGYVDITSSALADGAHNLVSRVIDAAGNVGANSGKLAVTIDTAPPKATALPDIVTASDRGTWGIDNRTNVIKPVMSISLGTSGAKAGDTVDLREGDTLRGTATLTDSDIAKGHVDITSSALADGAHVLTSRVIDAAGNVGANSGKLAVTIDTAAPKAAALPDLVTADDRGTWGIDNRTNVTKPVMSISLGTSGAKAGDTVDLLEGTTVRGTASLTDSDVSKGYVDITTMTLAPGSHSLASRVTDVAGNVGAISRTLAVTIDTAPPTAVTAARIFSTGEAADQKIVKTEASDGTVLTVALGSSGAAAGDVLTLVIPASGTGAAQTIATTLSEAQISARSVGVTVSSVQLDAAGDGQKAVKAYVTDIAGNVGASATVGNFLLDVHLPVFTSAVTASVAENTSASSSVYTVAATDGTAVAYSLSGADAGLFNIDSRTGVVKFLSSPNFEAPKDADGNNVYDVTVKATDAAGQTSTHGVAITVTGVNEDPTVVGSIDAQHAVPGHAYTLSGATVVAAFKDVDAGSVLTYSMSGQPSGFSIDSSTGAITGTASVEGSHTVTVTATDQGGLHASQTFSMTESAAPRLSTSLDDVTNFEVTSNIVLTANENVTAVAGKFIHIWDDGGNQTTDPLTGDTLTGFRNETSANNMAISVTSSMVTISGSKININPGFDLDLSSNYHITIDEGAFLGASSNGASVAVSSTTAMNFSTVSPGMTSVANAVASQKMVLGADVMVAGRKWLDLEGIGSLYGDGGTELDVSTGNFALVFKDRDPAAGTPSRDGIAVNDMWATLTNFNATDQIYVDDQQNDARVNNVTVTAAFGNGSAGDPLILGFTTTDGDWGGAVSIVFAEGVTANAPTIAAMNSALHATSSAILSG